MPSGVYDHKSHSKESYQKAVETRKNNGKPWNSEESNKKRVESRRNNGKPWNSEEATQNMRKAAKNKPLTTEETKQNMRGPRGPQGPMVHESDGLHYTCTGKLREEIRDRDNQTCQVCGRVWQEGERLLDTHHIYGSDDNKEPCDMTRLITLCNGCHTKINKHYADYIPQFELIVNQEFVWCGT